MESAFPIAPAMRSSVSFKQEICAMMYVFGDVPKANEDAAEIIESVLRKHMMDMVDQMNGFRKTRKGKSLALEDVFFLYRNDPVKIKRMLSVLRIRETSRSVSTEEGKEEEAVQSSLNILSESSRYLSGLPTLMQEVLEMPGGISVLDVDNTEDFLQIERSERADLLTEGMDVEEYRSYSKLRTFNYIKDVKKFKEWLDHPVLVDAKVSSGVLEAIGYVCYEATREFVEKCLLVVWESPLYRQQISLPREQVYQANNQIFLAGHMTSHAQGIQPSHVNEVIRRQGISAQGPLF